MASGVYGLTTINDCTNLNQENEIYSLTKDIYTNNSVCMIFSANHTTLEMNGYKITGNSQNFTAVQVYENTIRTTIENGTIENASIGILDRGGYTNVFDMKILNTGIALKLLSGADATVENTKITNSSIGFEFNSSGAFMVNSIVDAQTAILFIENNDTNSFGGALINYNSTLDESKIIFNPKSFYAIVDFKRISVYDENNTRVDASVWVNMSTISPYYKSIFGIPEEEGDWEALVYGSNDEDSTVLIRITKGGVSYNFEGNELVIKVITNDSQEYFYKKILALNYNPYENWTFILGQNISLTQTNDAETSSNNHHHSYHIDYYEPTFSSNVPEANGQPQNYNNPIINLSVNKNNPYLSSSVVLIFLAIGIIVLLIVIIIILSSQDK